MDGLQVSNEISKLSRKIEALNRVIMTLDSNIDFNYEVRVLKEIKVECEQEKSKLEDKLRSVTF